MAGLAIDLRGRRALVTGGNSGIGEGIALALGRCGADVAINYIAHRQAAADLVEIIERNGVRALALRADVTRPAAIDALFAEIDAQWEGVDIVVANAGLDGRAAKAWEAEPAAWQRVLDVNLTGAFLTARAALQRMIPARDGVVIFTSSVHEVIPWSGHSAYAASKAGLAMLMQSLAQEAAEYGVRVLAVAPGAIRTSLNADEWRTAQGQSDIAAKVPLARLGEPEEVGNLVAFLASGLAAYVTGTTVTIDGGMTLYPSFREGG